jgi:amphi-Trp domain-containing protein
MLPDTPRTTDRHDAGHREGDMDLFEIGSARSMRREEAAAQLHALADEMARNNAITLDRDGRRITVAVPDTVELKLEVEIEDDEGELEIEISW